LVSSTWALASATIRSPFPREADRTFRYAPLLRIQEAFEQAGVHFIRCVENGEPPRLFGVEPPRARIEAVRIVRRRRIRRDWSPIAKEKALSEAPRARTIG
jgi:hypothetical protein